MTEQLSPDQMSDIDLFEQLEKPDVIRAAEEFGTEFNARESKGKIINRMVNEGITWQMYQDFLRAQPAEEPEVETIDALLVEPTTGTIAPVIVTSPPPKEPEPVLIKMTRPNFSYEIRGYRFSKQHPFVLVKEEDANYLIESGDGFRPASPREFSEWYAKV